MLIKGSRTLKDKMTDVKLVFLEERIIALLALLEHFHLGANGDLYIKMKFVTVEISVTLVDSEACQTAK